MRITDHHGLALADIVPEEVAQRPWRGSDKHIDVVRLPNPPDDFLPELAGLGFVHKPELLSWRAELGPDEEEFLARLATKPRQDIRRSIQRAEAALTLTVHDTLPAPLLDRFLDLYRSRVAEMTYGITIACRYRDAMLDGPDKYYGVFAMDGAEIAGGCLVRECPDEETVRIRFSAVTEEWRRASLARTLYFGAMRVARDKGFKWVTLGDEPNLYGHLTKMGLFPFKVAMGFHPVPSQDNHDPEGRDLADLVLTGTHLSGPGLMLGYVPGRRHERQLTGYVISDEPVDLKRIAAPFLDAVVQVPPGERAASAAVPLP
ncbi:GNAT family N-acetyltransferase [Micromonospora sp. M61]|uniref:GNAT family N-acetyltransferase n=1 Tax=Micromonospora sp. M61 TaxID=2824890 RepID=UPI001B374578|nr:GNAT family N-acetyltransferase [Micromonospora sp. M61]MBQ0981624.1 GNAT family N-acetyltransferase [Micromonospora sp. M61]